MNSQLFFFLNLVFGIAFLAWFLSTRKSARPTKLKMRPGQQDTSASSRKLPPEFSSASAPAGAPRAAEAPRQPEPQAAPSVREILDAAPKGKMLNVMFLYNGHDWDAYAVLGLPAGVGLPTVTKRYQELVRNGDQGQIEFYEAAYQAILRKS